MLPSPAATAPYVGRLAPSPTGALHLGNARSFLITWLRCRARGGRLIMRMEDLNIARLKPDAVQEAYDDLRWLGIDWDEGPASRSPPEDTAPYIQSQRLPVYQAAFDWLNKAGLIYPCVCTRREIVDAQSAPHAGHELRYPNTCRGKFNTTEAAQEISGRTREPGWRFIAPDCDSHFTDNFCGAQTSNLQTWSGDFLIAQTRDKIGYQLAVVIDDAAMGITEVVRADDLLSSTHRQLALYAALQLPAPQFLHVPLVIGPDGVRLAKRHGSTRISQFRAAGTRPERVIGWLAHTCGWAERGEEINLAECLNRFTLDTIAPTEITVDAAVHAQLGLTQS